MLACAPVLGIGEPLESILLNLPPKDLLLAQRPSTNFRDSIKTSQTFQHALYRGMSPMPADVNSLLLPGSEARESKPKVRLPLPFSADQSFCYFAGYAHQEAAASFGNLQAHYTQDVVEGSEASWLDMHVQQAKLPVRVVSRHDTLHGARGRRDWIGAQVTVHAPTSRKLLALGVSTRRAADRSDTEMRMWRVAEEHWVSARLHTDLHLEREQDFSAERIGKIKGEAKFKWNEEKTW
ncbi:hypothetical protein DOTSEDRAFT_38293 [Dothistroma septosporum NZE10]|uniref:F-box domain-containing protein n=1 Tax=Dothistroma septosporum (strain NZE10 / CBS 128990) TaxID=675120 RepID=N1PDA8_DOTSN|nr:hypothetical protein DOTSEDRAFT_38293 [Dothistroma septosporum NZE10]